uniref:Peroxidase 66 n=1 Tax=Rhizophora mucronata TaxID=61149 RepID=A0A2P2ITZ4_RHIMU
MLGSVSCTELKLRSRVSKEEQWENPRVWPPDKATKSLMPRPLLSKL